MQVEIAVSRATRAANRKSRRPISDWIGYYRGSRALWDWFRKLLISELDEVCQELAPFAVCDRSM